jgi:hypothetical protein
VADLAALLRDQPSSVVTRCSLCPVRRSGGQQGTWSVVKRSAWPGRQRDERQFVEELRVPLPDVDAGGMRTVEIAETLGFGETPVRKLLTG